MKIIRAQDTGLQCVRTIADNYAKAGLKIDVEKVPDVVFENQPYTRLKACYNNALQYAVLGSPDVKYILGFVLIPVPIEHAWVRDGGRDIDVTKKIDGEYIQVLELSRSDLMKFYRKHHFGPSLYDLVKEQ